jgi:hypothetical protein
LRALRALREYFSRRGCKARKGGGDDSEIRESFFASPACFARIFSRRVRKARKGCGDDSDVREIFFASPTCFARIFFHAEGAKLAKVVVMILIKWKFSLRALRA